MHVSVGWHTRWSYLQNGDAIKLLTLGSLRDLGSQVHFHGRYREERLPAGQQRAPRMPRRFWKPELQRVEGELGETS